LTEAKAGIATTASSRVAAKRVGTCIAALYPSRASPTLVLPGSFPDNPTADSRKPAPVSSRCPF
jgi:hypothetical protein